MYGGACRLIFLYHIMDNLIDFHGPNAGYIIELYARYQEDPNAVDAQAQALFAQWAPQEITPLQQNGVLQTVEISDVVPDNVQLGKAMAVANLAQAIREYGHLAANTNPLTPPTSDPSIDPNYHGLSAADLRQLPSSLVGGPIPEKTGNAYEAIDMLREVYCRGAGYDYDHLTNPEEREWLREAAESRRFRQAFDPDGDNAIRLLKRLIKIETFEQYLHKTFVGKKRFSIEGLDMMVPVLDEIIGRAIDLNVKSVLIGMAHRGRLNVLAHVLNKPYADILREFKDPISDIQINASGYLGKTGDVKYHKGARRSLRGLQINIAANPSHLELVNPVVSGMARAAGSKIDAPGAPFFDPDAALPIQIHGDAAFPGQGTVAETLNFANLGGFTNGGTIHIIANNQVGFTTNPNSSRSTRYASDLAKGFKIPIVHVNANDPITCLEVARLAIYYRQLFNKDFLIDLIGYRRFGHNEGDEPRFTQPVKYETVDSMPTVLEMWTDTLVKMGFITQEEKDGWVQQAFNRIQQTYESLDLETPEEDPTDQVHRPEPGIAGRTPSAVPAEQLTGLHKALMTFPDHFNLHPRLKRVVRRRMEALDDPDAKTIDWGTAEQLALASILADGTPVRMTGEDIKRGTFSHRHAVYFDSENGADYTPLQALPQSEASFEIHNSPLTESAIIGFEYGYNTERPDCLVIWEAQFGDFINGAQMMIDEYVSSGRAKWNHTPSLVLLLPHGYEGQGPDHSSARLERFLQLTAEKNMRVVNCTTAAQYFHVLRRQALLLTRDPLPLIVMAPKSLLRHPMAASSLAELAADKFYPVIDDPDVDHKKVKRLVLCSGKVYVDLISSDLRARNMDVAVARVEQLYPFPKEHLQALFERYPNVSEICWLQEEPRNMGAWRFMQPRLNDILPLKKGSKTKVVPLNYIGRRRYASPAEGSMNFHKIKQDRIVAGAFDLNYVDSELIEKKNN